ncbi:BTAD domain-containing putative transcriptional regulator [Streptomyces sp. NPDC006368]|uniref:BTAD domain-containing putative transcriptional regulator n=1 Tax=Streptomyces sp. NPDC006368 TaxID=3156760 RepID=UPI0033BD8048
MRFRMLGPLEVMAGDRPVPLGGTKQRATLGYLLLQANQVVPTSQLLSALWSGEDTPATARKILQNAVWGLRGMLTTSAPAVEHPATLVTRAPGYMINVDPDQVDLHLFRKRVHEGRARLAAGRPEEAVPPLCEALELWRGPVLADLVERGTSWPELTAVQNTRLDVLEDYFEAKLQCAQHYAVLGELETTVEAEPLRERTAGQLMLALYRCGRQADALGVYHRIRATLVEDLGLEPGHELRRMQQAILAQDPALDIAPAAAVTADRYLVGVPGGRVRQREEHEVYEERLGAGAPDGRRHRDERSREGRPHEERSGEEWPHEERSREGRSCEGRPHEERHREARRREEAHRDERRREEAAHRDERRREAHRDEPRRTPAGVFADRRVQAAAPPVIPAQGGRVPVPRRQTPATLLTTTRQRVSVLLVRSRLAPGLGGGAAESMDQVFESVNASARRQIERLGGETVASIGAVTLGLFRSPDEESAALSAVRAAVALRDRLTVPAVPSTPDGTRPASWRGLTLHAAVATGQALVRFRQDDPTVPSAVNGALIDRCQSLLALAPPGGIQVCDATRAAAASMVEYALSGGAQAGWRVLDGVPEHHPAPGVRAG